MTKQTLRDPKVVIIGAGMTGILLAIELDRIGVKDITILEKKSDLGGTWRENTYPGVACDIPAHMYTYSFAPNPEWSHRFAHGDEIHAYFKRVSEEFKVTPKIHFNEAVTEATYQNGKWTTKTSKGQTYISDFLISATGILHHPAKPNIPGLESFQGKCFHTAEWDHSVALEGKRIGVIGTGSTAAQVIPEMIKVGKKVSVFQRTPQWIVKVPDTTYTEEDKQKWRKEPNILKRFHKWYTFAVEQTFSKAVIGKKIPHLLMSFLCKRNLRTSIKDPVLRQKLTPNYRVGCKRVIVNSTFYDAIQKPNADLVTEGIEKITEKGVVTKDGKLHELDVLVLATGFHPFNFMRPMNLTGENGISIETAWKKKVQAYRSLFIPHFPNFVLMLGPNTPIGNFSVIAMSEVQTKYVLKIIEDWRKGKFNAIDAKEEALQRFAAYLKKGMVGTVWLGGCQSWYLDPDGDPAMWPYTWSRWEKEMKTPDYQDFRLISQ
ncbi:NAD(P)/FAD-dependent oxidoreductase [Leptospira kemamanensis]|uniref:NAD(P)/FAD-dependent oxidoreductase n=1 Tax=Leptospira kemamanensis TaxID=2484942 RepID=A0A4R9JUS1_9LEPT|nr:NAD(P)/FAD-dependent oxidoreductase [Leptospira kemamanensis]TGL55103.1 NAD(P)/FAD-dependent oxidoreductase [Leptospira kemamanensis]